MFLLSKSWPVHWAIVAIVSVPCSVGLATRTYASSCVGYPPPAPPDAIVFGDVNDKTSRAAAAKSSPRAFHVLEEINIKPNVTYLAKVRNPSADASPGDDAHSGSHPA